jgi:hypothetical protein
MAQRTPSFFLLVPGDFADESALNARLEADGFKACAPGAVTAGAVAAQIIEDDGLARGFASNRYGKTGLEARVAPLRTAIVVEVGWRLDEHRARTAALGRALRAAGGVAVRMEGSGAAWDFDAWLERIESNDWVGLYGLATVIVADSLSVFTCGMQQFDRPDVQVSADVADPLRWLDELCLFVLAEEPFLATGHTFRPDDSVPRRRLERWPDAVHPPRDGRHNPFGLWRLVNDDERALRAADPIPFLMPSLVATLFASERKRGTPLSRPEVLALVDAAPAIEMTPRDADALERSRGYADLEPRRAWEQWSLVREAWR